jgi:hypothetical protein
MPYLPRIADAELTDKLASSGAVLIEGPRACGKTATALQVAASTVRFDTDRSARAAAEIDPALILNQAVPVLLDEWQVIPTIWNHVRRAVDDRQLAGQFILTGSAVPTDDVNRHSGAGRFATLRMRPMCLFESGHSTGNVSLEALFAGEAGSGSDPGLTVPDLADRITVGGWPAQQTATVRAAAAAARGYLEQVRQVDLRRLDGPSRDPRKVEAVLRSLAQNTATEVANSVLAADAGGSEGLHRGTVADYLDALERLMIVEDQPAWAPRIRSRSRLRKAPKRHFVDPSLAVAALGAGPERLLADLNAMGFLFESLVVRDLRVLSQPLRGEVLHYRDSDGHEVDAIVQLADGRWAGFEVKLGAAHSDRAAASLTRFASLVDTDVCGPPAALVVITGTGYAYRRPDGVYVVPIGALGP